MKYLKYLFYIIEHKINVGIECWKTGLYWHAITHDFSKFRPSEFFPYARYFYGGKKNKKVFDDAWKLHYERNKHHWEHWTYWGQDGDPMYCPPVKQLPLHMPEKYLDQMLCDWRGMARKLGDTANDYYSINRDKIILDKYARDYVERKLGL